MNFNWGKAIASVIILFILGMAFMVYKSVTKNIDLVTPNYYEKEIKYQEQINKINNTSNLKEQVKFENLPGALVITFPALKGSIKGEVAFYRPSDAKQDFQIPINFDNDSKQHISTERLQKGLWKIQINWNAEGKEYFNEEKIMIQ